MEYAHEIATSLDIYLVYPDGDPSSSIWLRSLSLTSPTQDGIDQTYVRILFINVQNIPNQTSSWPSHSSSP